MSSKKKGRPGGVQGGHLVQCHQSSLSTADGAAAVPELAVFDHQVKSFYNFFGHSVDLRTIHSHVQQRMQETVRHLKKGIVTRCVCAPVPVRYRGLVCGFRPVKHSFSIGKLTGARQHRWLSV
jgi:hypothetical protein